MIDFQLAIAVHVLAIVVWIGGVAMITTVVLPALRRRRAEDRLSMFETIERRFGWQARGTTLLAGASGFYMVDRLGLWSQLVSAAYWWLGLMVAVWLIFTILLFFAEPLFLHRWLTVRAQRAPEATLLLLERAHWVLLILSLAAIAGAVIGSHG